MLIKIVGSFLAGLTMCSLVANADDVPANKNTKSVLPLGQAGLVGSFETLLDADWHKFRITKGDHYAVVLIPDTDGRYKQTLIDDLGKTRITTYGYSANYPSGYEFTAAATADRFVGVKLERLYDGATLPVSYRLLATKECDNTVKTNCAAVVNETKNSTFAWYDDRDWWKVAVKVGQRYRVTLNASMSDRYIDIMTNVGTYQVGDSRVVDFTAAYTGYYFLNFYAYGGAPGAPYSFVIAPL